jgi:cellobiose phosphorylase
MYRVAIESMLGIQVRGDRLTVNPCIPADWPEFEVKLRRGETCWRIRVLNPQGIEHGRVGLSIDGEATANSEITLAEDDCEHLVEVTLLAVSDPMPASGRRAAKLAD